MTFDQAVATINNARESVAEARDKYLNNNPHLAKFRLIGDPTGQYLRSMLEEAFYAGYNAGQMHTGEQVMRTIDIAFDAQRAREELERANQTGRVSVA